MSETGLYESLEGQRQDGAGLERQLFKWDPMRKLINQMARNNFGSRPGEMGALVCQRRDGMMLLDKRQGGDFSFDDLVAASYMPYHSKDGVGEMQEEIVAMPDFIKTMLDGPEKKVLMEMHCHPRPITYKGIREGGFSLRDMERMFDPEVKRKLRKHGYGWGQDMKLSLVVFPDEATMRYLGTQEIRGVTQVQRLQADIEKIARMTIIEQHRAFGEMGYASTLVDFKYDRKKRQVDIDGAQLAI